MPLVQVASDNFNRANGGLGANWTTGANGNAPSISSNVVIAGSFADHDAFWNANAFDNNQYSQATVVAIAGSSYIGVTCRANATDYVVGQQIEDFGGCAIFWYNGGAFTEIAGDSAGELVAGDVIRLEAEGTTFRFYVNDSLRLTGTNASAPSSGSAGLMPTNTGDQLDNWSGGNIVAGNTPTRMLMGMGT